MGQGSQEVYISYPLRSNVPSLAAAARIALTSACAVGSQDVVTRFTPVATITPSLVAITAHFRHFLLKALLLSALVLL